MNPSLSPFHEILQNWTQSSLQVNESLPVTWFESRTNPDKAKLLVLGLFVVSGCQHLIEQHWIVTKKESRDLSHFQVLVHQFLEGALGQRLSFLAPFVEQLSPVSLRKISEMFQSLTDLILQGLEFQSRSYPEFVQICAKEISELCLEQDLNGPILYRTFERLDEVLNLDYSGDFEMTSESSNPERLYAGAAAGVQTSYTTILAILDQMNLPPNSHLMDLGSGFGRVGLMAGLIRPDLRFSGYEYVGHRVHICQSASRRCGFSDRIRFFQQDLSEVGFEIPEADAYYLYDPFCKETYQRVLTRLNEVAKVRPLVVVTKADAGVWFQDSLEADRWERPEPCDGGTISIYRTKDSSLSV